jgi:hypothetical protein
MTTRPLSPSPQLQQPFIQGPFRAPLWVSTLCPDAVSGVHFAAKGRAALADLKLFRSGHTVKCARTGRRQKTILLQDPKLIR